jgi:hypothetical protein
MEHRKQLSGCRHGGAYLARKASNNAVCLWCPDCDDYATKARLGLSGVWVPKDHPILVGVDRMALPLVGEQVHRLCEHCNERRVCQAHHVACQSLFDDADAWPVVWLCTACHDQWHDVVTPYMPGHINPTRIADILHRWLTPDQQADTVARLRALRTKEKAA